MKEVITSKWIKASVAGSMWAASEIVIGSFLHNLRVPFSGSIMTAIGIILLISISYRWNEKGLFWRAGIVCALMKTLSPSAVIFGPVVAIITESLLLEFATRIAGRRAAGYIAGAILAMSWNLVQRILTLVIFYGSGIVDVYSELADMVEKQAGIEMDIAWLPILIILSVYIAAGFIAAMAGLKLGKSRTGNDEIKHPDHGEGKDTNRFNDPEIKRSYSIIWLFINFFMLIASMLILSYGPLISWLVIVPPLIIIWISRYRRAMRQLLNPKFWILFLIITFLTSLVFTKTGSGESGLTAGLIEALRMNLRAATVILGFSASGTELYNPRIRNYFNRTLLKDIPPALEMAAESLPAFIAGIPSLKTIIKNPVSSLSGVLALADKKIGELQNDKSYPKIIIITGGIGEGKTTLVKKLVELLKKRDKAVYGFYSERVLVNKETVGYDLVDIEDNSRVEFLRTEPGLKDYTGKTGKYHISARGLKKGRSILCNPSREAVCIIDEAGRLELRGEGWAPCLDDLFRKQDATIILAVRNSLVSEFIRKWNIRNALVVKLTDTSPADILDEI